MSPRSKIISLISIIIVLSIVYKMGLEILFYPLLFLGAVLVLYALNLRCQYCGERQVFRGYSFFDLRLPKDSCYKCGSPLGKPASKKAESE